MVRANKYVVYDDCLQGIRDAEKRLSTSREALYTDPLLPENCERARPMIKNINGWLLNVDPPDHTRMRKLVNLAFTPRMLQDLKPRIAEIVDNLLERTASQLQDTARHPDGLDFIDSFTLPLPALVICEMLGVPDDKRDRYCRCV